MAANDKPDTTETTDGGATTSGGPIPQPAKTPSSAGGATEAEQKAVKVELTQPAPDPEVHYPGNAVDATDPNRPHVKADYQPFKW